MTGLWQNPAYQTLALGAGLLGGLAGGVGCLAVVRRRSLQGDAVAHAALPGIALAFLLGARETYALLLGAVATGWLALAIVARLQRSSKVPFDAGLAGSLAVFFGVGVALLSYIRAHVKGASEHGLERYLMGQAATMRMEDLRLVFGVGIVCVAVLVVFWKPIHMVCFDPEYAKTQGYHPIRVDGLMAGVLVAAVVVGLQAVGVVLMSALVVAPAVAARLFVQRLAPMILLAALFGALAGVLGVTLSTVLSVRDRAVPTGPTIVLMVSAIVGVAMGVHTVIQRRARTLGATV